jgi:two-component system sensor histidine kinase ChiS
LISKLWPDIPWDILLKSDLIGFYLGAALLLLFLHFLYPREGSKWVARFAFFAGVVASLFVLLTPGMVAGLSVPYYEIIVALYTPYGIWQLTRAVLRRRQGAALILVGFCLFAVAGVNDILHDLEIIQTASLTTVGVFVFLLFNTAMLSIRFSRAYVDVEKLSQSLESKNEELHRLDQLKDEFLAKTSHELRTPLHAINGLAESLLAGSAGALTPAMQQDLGLLSASAQRLSRLVNDILDAAKLKYSDLVLQPRAVNIHAVVAAVLEVLRGTIGQRALLLVNNVPKDLPMASADEDRLQQIFYNLVGNAIKHTDTGQICIEAREHGGMLEMSVTDSGSGIPQERLAQIFEPYEQLENAGKNKAGTGLGLSVVRQLIELQGGYIEVDSTYSSGARFVFTLPYARELELKSFAQVKEYPSTTQRASASESALLTPDTTRAAADDTRPSVLAIDDEAVNLRLLHHYLDEHYRLTTLGSGKEALRLLQSEPLPDLLLLDLMMPVTSGYDVCRTLRKSYDEAELPIVILTAKNSNDDLIAAFAAGANDYLNKPFGRDELLARVGAQLQTRAAVNSQRQLLLLQRKLDAHKASEMKSKLEAEQASLRMLRYQLNPHLIFNALASIRGAIVSEPQVARDMVTRLAEFCRLALQQGQRQTQTLADELLMVRNYIEIEKARLGEYLSFDAHIDVELEHLEVPALLLQPLVENAVKYGKLSNQQALRISVDVRRCNDSREDERVSLTVANTGHWIEQNSEKGFGIGRANLVARLQKQYTDRYDISVEESDGWVRVRLQLPLQPFAVVDVEKA